jgi:hypothetical protein
MTVPYHRHKWTLAAATTSAPSAQMSDLVRWRVAINVIASAVQANVETQGLSKAD